MAGLNVKIRNSKLDNIKGVLIILVVMGHLLELDMEYGINRFLYIIIYTFHMPVFVFVSGYFANFSIKRTIKKLLYPYILFQFLYLLFAKHVLNLDNLIQFTTPYWLLWYLWAMVIWTLMIPVIKSSKIEKKVVFLVIVTIVSISIGYENAIGRILSLSRIFVFFPFFICGYYAKEWNREEANRVHLQNMLKKHKRHLTLVFCVCITWIIGYCIGHYEAIDRNWLYEAVSYQHGAYTMGFRILHLSMGFIWLLFLLFMIPNKNIPILTNIGINTMPIFLMHGFIIKMIGKYKIMNQMKDFEYIGLFFLLAFIVLLLSSKIVCKVFRNLLSIPDYIGKFIYFW